MNPRRQGHWEEISKIDTLMDVFFKTLPRSFLKVVPIQKGPQSLIHNNIYMTHFAAAFSPHLATSLGFMRLQDMDL